MAYPLYTAVTFQYSYSSTKRHVQPWLRTFPLRSEGEGHTENKGYCVLHAVVVG